MYLLITCFSFFTLCLGRLTPGGFACVLISGGVWLLVGAWPLVGAHERSEDGERGLPIY